MRSARIKKDRAGTQNTFKNQRLQKVLWLDLERAELTAFFNITKYCIEEIY